MADEKADLQLQRVVAKLNKSFATYLHEQYQIWNAEPANVLATEGCTGLAYYQMALKRHERWKSHIKPLAEAWWNTYGFTFMWPLGSDAPPRVRRIRRTAA